MRSRISRVRHAVATVALVATVLLAGCTAGESDGAVGLADASSAVIAVSAGGIVAEPGGAAADTPRTAAGFVIAAEGLAVTTADAAVGATDLAVRVGTGEGTVPATIVGVSECLDLAVLRLDGEQPFFAWRRGAVREETPLRFTGADAVLDGKVSSVEEPLTASWVAAAVGIRHDLALPVEASGAPLLDDEGRVAAVAHVGDSLPEDAPAAVATEVARKAVQQIITGDAHSLGISARAWTDAEGVVSGVWVRAVSPDGPAALAGVQAGDVLTELGATALRGDTTLSSYCAELSAAQGAPMALEVYRPSTDEVLVGDTAGAPLAVASTGEIRRSGAFATVVDASGLVRVDVPVEWGQADGAGFTDAAGKVWYSVTAAPSVARFQDRRTAPGVQVAATGGGASAGDLLTALSSKYAEECSPIDAFQPYDDGLYAGAYSRYSCDGTLAMVVSVRNARGNNVVLVAQLLSPADQGPTLSRMLSTFGVGRG